MLFSRSVKYLIVGFALVAIAMAACAKKKSSDSPDTKPQVDPKAKSAASSPAPTPAAGSVVGKESVEGTSVIFRGSDGVFVIKATPHSVTLGQMVTFEGTCSKDPTANILWNFGDGAEEIGASVQHAYYVSQPSFSVKGSCLDANGNVSSTVLGTLTITIAGSTGTIANPPVIGTDPCTCDATPMDYQVW